MELRGKILQGAYSLFNARGLKSVTMEEVAGHLGMSKKTLYSEFRNKEEVIIDITRLELEKQKNFQEEIKHQSLDAVHEILLVMECLSDFFSGINPQVLLEVRKYYPRAWKLFEEHKELDMMKSISENLKRGIKEGFYRKDINVPILTRLRMGEVMVNFDHTLFPPRDFHPKQIHEESLKLFLYGITTVKGRNIITKHQNRSLKKKK